ncbi:hypothetical protein [Botrimarina sp.]|uniref:hypothetical protein n=1 Tax=Botrimarina sp. TaxID=2795802 RepID=UPI0032F03F6E
MRILLLLVVVAPLLAGCSDGRPKRYKVSGKVVIDGQPMKAGLVQVLPEGNRPAAGAVAEDGTFTLGSYELNDGVVPGTHKVAVNGAEPMGPTKTKWYAPPQYRFANSSGLTMTVEEDRDDVVIEIDTGGPKPFQPFIEIKGRGGDASSDTIF